MYNTFAEIFNTIKNHLIILNTFKMFKRKISISLIIIVCVTTCVKNLKRLEINCVYQYIHKLCSLINLKKKSFKTNCLIFFIIF